MFSKSCEYAIKIMVYLSIRNNHGKAGLAEISNSIGSPRPFTAKVLQSLTKSGFLVSARGPGGGFKLEDRDTVNLRQIVEAVDGSELFKGCVLGFEECTDHHPCPLHHKFEPIRNYLYTNLSAVKLSDIEQLMKGQQGFLKEPKVSKK